MAFASVQRRQVGKTPTPDIHILKEAKAEYAKLQ
jgi:hypothetical protein